jgi:DnaJ-class molecular chaperone
MSEDVIRCPHCQGVVRSKVCPDCGGAKSLQSMRCLQCSVPKRQKPTKRRAEQGNGWPRTAFAKRMIALYGDKY